MKIKSTYQYFTKTIIAIIVLISSLAATYTYSSCPNFRQITQTELVVSIPKPTNLKTNYQFFSNKNTFTNNQTFPYLFENALRNFNQKTQTQFTQTKKQFSITPIRFQNTKLIPQNDDIATGLINI